mmetsp:Transcript_4626/g.8141  ORF Transcript_4626/g.8141 Transcript_4626/m.8141 type:complete len:2389 (-) Transcript_4626:34-7200(-)
MTKASINSEDLSDTSVHVTVAGLVTATLDSTVVRDALVTKHLNGETLEISFASNAIVDMGGNAVPAGINVITVVSDTVKPTIVSVVAHHGLDTLTITASESLKSIDWSKVTLRGNSGGSVVLSGTDDDIGAATAVHFLSESDQVAMHTISPLATVDFADGAFVDLSGNEQIAASGFTITSEIDDTIKPAIQSVDDLDLETGKLTLIFTESIDTTAFDVSKVTLKAKVDDVTTHSIQLNGPDDVVTPAAISDSLVITLSEVNRVFVAAFKLDGAELYLDLASAGYDDIVDLQNDAQLDISVPSFTNDEVAPTIESVDLDLNQDCLRVKLSEAVDISVLNGFDSSTLFSIVENGGGGGVDIDVVSKGDAANDAGVSIPHQTVYTDSFLIPLDEAVRTVLNIAYTANTEISLSVKYSAISAGIVDSSNVAALESTIAVGQIVPDTTPPVVTKVQGIVIKEGWVQIEAAESIAHASFNPSKFIVDDTLGLDSASATVYETTNRSVAFSLPDTLIASVLPHFDGDGGSSLKLSLLPGAIEDAAGNANTQIFEFVVQPDASYFEPKIFAVSTNQAVRGATKTISFTGTGIQEEALVKWVNADDDCNAAPVSLSDSDAEVNTNTLTIKTTGGQVGRARSLSQSVTFLTESDPSAYMLCYNNVLYSSFTITVFAITSMAQTPGADDRLVVDVVKTQTFSGIGIKENDRVKWVSSEDSCNDTPVHHSTSAEVLVSDSAQTTVRILRTDGQAEAATLLLCYKFGNEPYHLFSDISVSISKITSMTSTALLVAGQNKLFSFSGIGVSDTLDRVVWLDQSVATGDDACTNADKQLVLEPDNEISAWGATNAFITNAPMPPTNFRLCYGFRDEPLKLYSTIDLTVCEVTSYSVPVGGKHLAVKNAPKVFHFHGSGFDEDNDRVRWTVDANDVDQCTLHPGTMESVSSSSTHNTASGTLNFNEIASELFLCYGFGASEPYHVYPDVTLQVRTLYTSSDTRTVALLDPPATVVFEGYALAAGDSAKYVPQSDDIPNSEWCDQTHDENPGTTTVVTLGSVSLGAVVSIPFPIPSTNKPYVLCYQHQTEPYFLYSSITMQVDGLTSISQTEFIQNITTKIAIQGAGIRAGDVLRWIATPLDVIPPLSQEIASGLVQMKDAHCYNDSLVIYEVPLLNAVAQEITFPIISPPDTYHALCYNFAENTSSYKLYDSSSFAVRALGITYVSKKHFVVDKLATVKFFGTGIQSGDVAKWVTKASIQENRDSACENAVSLTSIATGETIVGDSVADIHFKQHTLGAVLCYKFKDHGVFKLYEDINIVVNKVSYMTPEYVIMGSTHTIVFDVTKVTNAYDRVKFIDASVTSCEEDNSAEVFTPSLISCTKRDTGLVGECGELTGVFNDFDGIKLSLCYYFESEREYTHYPNLRILPVAPKILVQSSNFYVSSVPKEITFKGTFGMTARDRFRFISQEVDDCEISEDKMIETGVSSTAINLQNLEDGEAVVKLNFNFILDESKPLKLCYRFGNGPMLMFREHTLTGQAVTSVMMLTSIDQAVANDPVQFSFTGVGISDHDTAKWVERLDGDQSSPDLCDKEGIAGSLEQIVTEAKASFKFSSATSAMLLCYKFNSEPYRTYPDLVLEMAPPTPSPSPGAQGAVETVSETTTLQDQSALVEEQQVQETKLQKEAKVTLTLDMNIAEIPPDSDEETAFKTNFTNDLSKSLGVPISRISIQGIVSGSVIVNFVILPPVDEGDSLAAESVVNILIEKVLDTESDLHTSSSVMKAVKKDVPVTVVVLDNEDAVAKAAETASAQMKQQAGEVKIIDSQQYGLFSFKEAVKIVVEGFDDYADVVVQREHGARGVIALSYSTKDGTAKSPSDFQAVSGVIRFLDGERTKTIRVPIVPNNIKGPHFKWFIINLALPIEIDGARLGAKATALVKIYDYGDGEVYVKESFGVESGSSTVTNGWSVVGNREGDVAWVDYHGMFGSDGLFAENEYDERCDLASPAAPCTYSCEYGGSYGESKGKDSGVLELGGTGYVASSSYWEDRALATEITITMWVKSSDRSQAGTLLSYQIPGDPLSELILHDHRDVSLVIKGRITDKRSMGIRLNLDVADGNWHFIAVTWSSAGGEVYCYKDGLLVFEGGPYRADKVLQQGGSFVLGQTQLRGTACLAAEGCSFEPNRGFNGEMQNVRIWNKVRTQSQIQGGMKWPFTLYQGALKLYWRFTGSAIENIALSGVRHDAFIGGNAKIGDGAPSNHPKYPCGKVNSNIFYFQTPPTFTGDLRSLYNGRLQFRLFSPSQRGSHRNSRGAVQVIRGEDGDDDQIILTNGLTGFALSDSTNGWRGYSAILHEDNGWVKEPSGTKATFDEFRHVLANVTYIRIRGDLVVYSKMGSGQEVTYLNDVALIRP